jgi:FkbH-like protein
VGQGGTRRVLVLDCDDTLWGGEVATLGPTGIALTTPYLAFQRHLAQLRQQGVRLAIATDNAPADARAPFLRNRTMVLSLSSFVAFEAGRGPKCDALRRMSERLGLPLAAFVFFDDSPTERAQVRRALPQVWAIDVPSDPADWIATLEAVPWCLPPRPDPRSEPESEPEPEPETNGEAARVALRRQYGTHEAFLDALELTGEVRAVTADDVTPVVEVAATARVWHTNPAREATAAVRDRLADPDAFARCVRVWDRFGDEGIVGVLVGRRDGSDPACLRIETLALTDRGADRTAQWLLLARSLAHARAVGLSRVVAQWTPTVDNGPMAALLETLGLPTCAPGEPARDTAELAQLAIPETFVTAAEP